MKKYAMWVHGTAVQPEREGYHINKARAGFGARFSSTGSEWFHFAVPTPVIADGQNTTLEQAFVLYRTTMTTHIIAVHLYDGRGLVHKVEPLNWSGDHGGGLDQQTLLSAPANLHVKFGLGISVAVAFGDSTPSGVPSIEFVSAGADFLVPG